MGDPGVLAEAAFAAGLDPLEATAVLASDRYASEVRAEEAYWRREGIQAVPTFVINSKYVISGGHPPEAFERALGRIAKGH
jgi:predicted DsbA family dithiol-disulfide isomerase